MTAECILVPQECLLYDSNRSLYTQKISCGCMKECFRKDNNYARSTSTWLQLEKYFCCYVRSNFCNSSITNFGNNTL